MYTLLGPDRRPYRSATPGGLGGNRSTRIFGRLDCPGALRLIAAGGYVKNRVFFADRAAAWAAGYRPCHGCLRAEYAEWTAGRAAFDIDLPGADAVLAFLGARAVPGLETWDGETFRRQWAESTLTIAVDSAHLARVEVAAGAGGPADLHAAARAVRSVLDVDAPLVAVTEAFRDDPLLGPLVRARPHLRSPGAFDAYEVAVRAVVGQAIAVAAARTILGRLAERGLFPQREALAACDPRDLPMPEARARALIDLARGVPLDEIRGVGPWTRGYVAMRTGDRDVLLHGDLIVRRSAGMTARELERRGERWAPYRSYATHHLWAAAA